jgi:TolA-binding protein
VTSPAPSPSLLAPPQMPSPPIPKTPVERPVPTVRPAPTPAAPALALPPPRPTQPEPSRLARESRWLASAIAKLRQEGQPEQALAILDQHQSELGSGALASEANATRIEALLRLGRNGQALVLLDEQRLSAQGLGREMLVARGELRAEKGRTSSAIHDFDQILSSPGRVDGITERALYGRATCRAKSSDRDGARDDFAKYLSAFPQGRFASEARAALDSPVR